MRRPMRNRYAAGRRGVRSGLLACLCLAGALIIPILTAPRPAVAQQSESDVFVAQAILAYEARRYDEALGFLEEALAQEPKNVEALYYKGLVLMAQQKTEAAVEPLERARTLAPTDFSVRFLLGVAYFSLERYDKPEPLLTQIFNERLQTGSALTGPAERIRDTIAAARERERRLHAEVRLGFLYDTNVAVNPQPSHDPTAEEVRRRKTHTTGEIGALRLDYTWLRTGPWESTVTYSFFQTYDNDLPSFNVQNHLAALR